MTVSMKSVHCSDCTTDGTQLDVFSSLKDSHGSDSRPLLTITVPRMDIISSNLSPMSSLSAGDAHFSFIMAYPWPNDDSEEDGETQNMCNNIWSIRTDSRSLEDSAWQPYELELSLLPKFVKVEYHSTTSEMPILCALQDGEICYRKCVSAGWITAAVSDKRKAHIIPFGRAMMMIPDLPAGEVEELADVEDISLGDTHVAVLTCNT